MISSCMALTGLLFIDLTSHTLEEKWTAVAYLHVYNPLPIQTVMIRTRQTKSDICTLCNMKQAEDRVHFILVCPALQTVRDIYLCRLQEVVPELKYLYVTKHEIVVQTLLDSSHPAVADYIVFEPHANRKVQSISRDFLYALHHERSRKINSARS